MINLSAKSKNAIASSARPPRSHSNHATAAEAARQHGRRDDATRQRALAASYQALHDAYQQRETVFAAAMADRTAWEEATRQQRQLAIAADAELRAILISRTRHCAQPSPSRLPRTSVMSPG
ncbi:MAG: hypothetical protein JWM19_2550 [Actinomycetia bacterium]|nr:hypothetical protein [Actinomycetes bacterium]